MIQLAGSTASRWARSASGVVPMSALVLFLASLIVRAAYLLAVGTQDAGDTALYEAISRDFSESAYRFAPRITYPALLYVFGSSIVLVQLVMDAGVTCLLTVICGRMISPRAGLVAGFTHIVLWDAFRWSAYILTDTTYMFLLTLVVGLVLGSKKMWPVAIIPTVLLLHLTRPTGLIFLFLLAGWGLYRLKSIPFAVGVLAISLVPLMTTLTHTGMPGSSLSSPEFAFEHASTVIQDGRQAASGYISAIPAKVVALYAPFQSGFSGAHLIVNMVLWPIYVFALVGSVTDFRNRAVQVAMLGILGFTMFHALTWVDYDQRYRAPALILLLIPAAAGFDRWALIATNAVGSRWKPWRPRKESNLRPVD